METQQTFRYEFITPARAAELLSRLHPRQRRAGPQKVGAYARTLADGRWNDHVPQPIMLSPDGLLLNGGHRLSAIAKSGIGATLLVAYDVPDDVFDVIDTGATRRAQQFLGGQLPTQQAACARWVMWAERRFDRVPSPAALTFDLDEVVMFADENASEIAIAVVSAVEVHRTSKIPVGVHAAVLMLAERSGLDSARIGAWIEGTASGVNLDDGDPRLALRTRFLTPYSGHSQANMLTNWVVIVTALNAHVHDERVGKLMSPRKGPGMLWPAVGEAPAEYDRRTMRMKDKVYNAKRRRKAAAASNGETIPQAARMAASS